MANLVSVNTIDLEFLDSLVFYRFLLENLRSDFDQSDILNEQRVEEFKRHVEGQLKNPADLMLDLGGRNLSAAFNGGGPSFDLHLVLTHNDEKDGVKLIFSDGEGHPYKDVSFQYEAIADTLKEKTEYGPGASFARLEYALHMALSFIRLLSEADIYIKGDNKTLVELNSWLLIASAGPMIMNRYNLDLNANGPELGPVRN